MIKNKTKLNDIINNDRYIFIISLVLALFVWLAVVINVSPETERTIQNVKVNIDTTVPAQFGLEVFGDTEFYVDVNVKGKKYQISSAALSNEDIIVTAQTNSVDSAGNRTLQLKAESASGSTDYTLSLASQKTIDVYFDTPKSIQMVIEPEVITNNFPIVKEGFNVGTMNLSKSSVTVTGPSTEVNKIEKAVARLTLEESLSSNKSADAEILLLSENGAEKFRYVKTNINTVVLTIPVLRVKDVNTTVLFKNAPDQYVLTPLKYRVSPNTDSFNILVDDYDKTNEISVGTIDFKSISPGNYVFNFLREDLPVAENSSTEKFTVTLDVSELSQDYYTIDKGKVKVNNPDKLDFKVSGLNKSVVVVGKSKDLESVTVDDIEVEIDISNLSVSKGQTISVPANVTVKSDTCWVYDSYTVQVSF